MKHDGRLARMLHVLIHMNWHQGRATSETIALQLGTNPVVVRRTMAGLREAGLVQSERGQGGGWVLAKPLDEISVLDVYEALGRPGLFAIGVSADHADCRFEAAGNAEIAATLGEAEDLVLARFRHVTLAQLVERAGVPAGLQSHVVQS